MIEKIKESDLRAVQKAAEVVLGGGVICFKSDTVYGFACDAGSDVAVEKLYSIKGRSSKKPIAMFVRDVAMAKQIFEFDDFLQDFCEKYLPGRVTVVAKVKDKTEIETSQKLSLESNFLGFRIVDGEFINELISRLNLPLAVTSANISDSKELLSDFDVYETFKNRNVDFLLVEGGLCESGEVSTVVKIDGAAFEVLRQGVTYID